VAERPNAPVLKTVDPATQTPSKLDGYDDGQPSLSPGLPVDLLEIIRCWSELPDALKAGIMAIVKTMGK